MVPWHFDKMSLRLRMKKDLNIKKIFLGLSSRHFLGIVGFFFLISTIFIWNMNIALEIRVTVLPSTHNFGNTV